MSADDAVSPQWRAWRAKVDLAEYERRFLHDAAHGEADLIESLARQTDPARSVLDAGCGTGRVAIELHRRGIDAVGADLDEDLLALAAVKAPDMRWEHVDLARMRLDRRFGIVVMAGNVLLFCRDEDRSAVVRTSAAHLEPEGLLVAGFSCSPSFDTAAYDELCGRCDLDLLHRWSTWDRRPASAGDGYAVSVHRRASA